MGESRSRATGKRCAALTALLAVGPANRADTDFALFPRAVLESRLQSLARIREPAE